MPAPEPEVVLGHCGLGMALEPVPGGELGFDLMVSGPDLKEVVPGPDLVVVEVPESDVTLLLGFVLEVVLEPQPDLMAILGSDLEEVPGPVLIMVLGSDLEVALACWEVVVNAGKSGGGLEVDCVRWAGVWLPLLLGLQGLVLPDWG